MATFTQVLTCQFTSDPQMQTDSPFSFAEAAQVQCCLKSFMLFIPLCTAVITDMSEPAVDIQLALVLASIVEL